ncbi:acetyl-CoA carboxylase [Rhizobium herbae]|uniref:Biotin carboxyl carrier protein n=1 Tax=Rhizobium herbae TaxID=508661 RepID=A0ABS4EQX2_9HYPH|nr:acetyl-CoA carboxylase [Rhizobium herbae]MBP1860348.1 biotin carboxyl carrier protein [Rhizobium herbae]
MSRVNFGDPAVIASLAAALEAAGVDGIEIEQDARKVRIVIERGILGAVPQVDASQHSSAATHAISVAAPTAGLFCSAHPASVAPPLELPREVVPGEMLGFIRVGPILLPVKASGTGILMRSLAGDGSLVGYGEPLFEIEPCP